MFKSRIAVYGALAVVGIAVALAGQKWFAPQAAPEAVQPGPGLQVVQTSKGPKIGGPFTLVDHDGKAVTDADFRGKFMLIFFGYTFCPDVCPTNLGTVSQALDMLAPEKADQIVPVFVSVDPDRDAPAQLKEFVSHFHPRMVGLTGTKQQVVDAARKYRVYYAKVQEKDSEPGDYLMDHTAITYLMGPDGTYRFHFGHGTDPEIMAQRLKDLIADEAKRAASS